MATDLLAQAGFTAPNVSRMGSWILYLFIALLIACLLALCFYLIVMRLKFNKKIILFRKVAGNIIPVANDKGILQRVGIAGDTWLRTRKFKKILPRPKIEMDKNTYWFYEREDGEWINFNLSDIDYDMKKAKSYYVDEDMRLQRLGIQRNLKDRFDKPSFWEKYGAQIMMVIFFLIVTICLIIIFNKMNDLIESFPKLAKALESLANAIGSNSQGMRVINNSGVPL